jgi:hypothetical protein
MRASKSNRRRGSESEDSDYEGSGSKKSVSNYHKRHNVESIEEIEDVKDDPNKLFIVENEGFSEQIKIISKKSMDDTDLLVNIHNSIVIRL